MRVCGGGGGGERCFLERIGLALVVGRVLRRSTPRASGARGLLRRFGLRTSGWGGRREPSS